MRCRVSQLSHSQAPTVIFFSCCRWQGAEGKDTFPSSMPPNVRWGGVGLGLLLSYPQDKPTWAYLSSHQQVQLWHAAQDYKVLQSVFVKISSHSYVPLRQTFLSVTGGKEGAWRSWRSISISLMLAHVRQIMRLALTLLLLLGQLTHTSASIVWSSVLSLAVKSRPRYHHGPLWKQRLLRCIWPQQHHGP